ncbi:MAG: hypothetical protein LUD03_05145, partial [Firmicutes bacterium]|nr:hypothetical protein [Bacillota bacterium]
YKIQKEDFMIYNKNGYDAVEAMERMRTGFFGEEDFCACEDSYAYRCPVCAANAPRVFYINDDDECVGCSECVTLSETP